MPELLLNTVHAYHSAALLPRQETLETSMSLVFRWSIIISQFPPVIFTFVFPENSPHHPAKFQSDQRSNQPTKTREFLKNANGKRREREPRGYSVTGELCEGKSVASYLQLAVG